MYNKTNILRKENNKLEESYAFKPETKEALTNIVVYLRGSKITEFKQEVVRRDITNMIIDGEKRGLSLQDIIGDDLKAFCDNVIAELPKMTAYELFWSRISLLCFSIGAILLGYGIYMFSSDTFPMVSISLGLAIDFVTLVSLGFILINYASKTAFDKSTPKFLTPAIFVVSLLLILSLVFLEKTLFSIHFTIYVAVCILLLLISKIIEFFS